MMFILAYDAYFFKKDSQVMLVKKAQKDSQALSIMMLIKMSVLYYSWINSYYYPDT